MARYTCQVAHDDDDWTKGITNAPDVHGANEILGYWAIEDLGGIILDRVTHAYADVDTSAIGSRTIIKAALKWQGTMTTSHAMMFPAYIIAVGNEVLYNDTWAPRGSLDPGGFWNRSYPLTALAIAEINGHGKTGVTFRTDRPGTVTAGRWHQWSIIAREPGGPGGAVQLLVETAERRYRCTVR